MFKTLVKKHFDFLKTEYGFEDNPHAFGYKQGDIELEFYHGKGELDICFFVRRTDDVFKAFVSRTFDMLSVIEIEKGRRVFMPKDLQGSIVCDEHIDNYLEFMAHLSKEYCSKQFNGDMTVFEQLHMKWRGFKK